MKDNLIIFFGILFILFIVLEQFNVIKLPKIGYYILVLFNILFIIDVLIKKKRDKQ